MARVVLTSGFGREWTGGEAEFEIAATNVRGLIRALDARFPGLGARLESEMAVAIDGEIFHDPFLQPVAPDSEVYFLPRIGGGSGRPDRPNGRRVARSAARCPCVSRPLVALPVRR